MLNFLKIFIRNKRGLLGLSIIAGFIILAIIAPFISPYTPIGQNPDAPNLPLAGKRAAPAWMRTLPPSLGGDPTLTENFWPIQRPGLPTLKEDNGEFLLETDEPEKITYKYSDTGFTVDLPALRKPENGSIVLKYSRSQGESTGETRVFLYTEFEFPYSGLPESFKGNVEFLVEGSTHLESYYNWTTHKEEKIPFLDVPIRVRVLLGPSDGKLWEIWPSTFQRIHAYAYSRGFERDVIEDIESLGPVNLSNPESTVWQYTVWEQGSYKEKNITLLEWEDRDGDKVLGISDIVTFEGEKTFRAYKIWDCETTYDKVTISISKQLIARPKSGPSWAESWIVPRLSKASETTAIPMVNPFSEFRERKDPQRVVLTQTPGNYTFGIEIVFEDTEYTNKDVSTTIYIDDLDIFFRGTCFGLLGTDHHGRDLFTQLIYGTRISLYLGFLVSVLGVSIGLVVGLAAGYLGRVVDELLMRFNDLLLCLPGLPLLIVLVAVLGTSIENLILLMGFLGWNGFARLVRSQVLSLKERPFVEAAKSVGAGTGHIIWRHILPNVMSLVYISLATSVPGAVTAEASLAWLGFYDPNRMSWGRMLYGVFESGAINNWWWVILPGLCLSLLAVSFILLGFALDDILNPKLRVRR